MSHNVSETHASADSDDAWMTITDAVHYTKVSRATLYRLMKQGVLPFYRVSGTSQRRFKKSELDHLMVREDPAALEDEASLDTKDDSDA